MESLLRFTKSLSSSSPPSSPSSVDPSSSIHSFTLFFKPLTFNNCSHYKIEKEFSLYYAHFQHSSHLRAILLGLSLLVLSLPYDYYKMSELSWFDSGLDGHISKRLNNENDNTIFLYLKTMIIISMLIALYAMRYFFTFSPYRKIETLSYSKQNVLNKAGHLMLPNGRRRSMTVSPSDSPQPKTYIHGYYMATFTLTLLLGSYILLHNFLMYESASTAGLCFYLIYIFSCTPHTFFYNLLYSTCYILLYSGLAINCYPDFYVLDSSTRYEILHLLLFDLLLLIPYRAHELTIRIHFLSELMMLSQHVSLKLEKHRSLELLHSMLPEAVIKKLVACNTPSQLAEIYEDVSILLLEVCEFNRITVVLKPREIVELLTILYTAFDNLVDKNKANKIETIGAIYVAAAGCPEKCENHAESIANLALDMMNSLPLLVEKIKREQVWGTSIPSLTIKVGLNSGACMAGIVGIKNPRFKLFGDTVNMTGAMAVTCSPTSIQMTENMQKRLGDRYVFEKRFADVKGRGIVTTYYLKGENSEKISKRQLLPSDTTIQSLTRWKAEEDMTVRLASIHSLSDHDSDHVTPTESFELRQRHQRSASISCERQTTPTRKKAKSSFIPFHSFFHAPSNSSTHPVRFMSSPAFYSKTTYFDGEKHVDFGGSVMDLASTVTRTSIDLGGKTSTSPTQLSFLPQEIDPRNDEDYYRLLREGLITDIAGYSYDVVDEKTFALRKALSQYLTKWNVFWDFYTTDVFTATASNVVPEDRRSILSALRVVFPMPPEVKRTSVAPCDAPSYIRLYYENNSLRWLHFFRISVLACFFAMPLISTYNALVCSISRDFFRAFYSLVLGFMVVMPVLAFYLLMSISNHTTFSRFQAVFSAFTVTFLVFITSVQSALGITRGTNYLVPALLYQCYFTNIPFFVRFAIGIFAVCAYIVLNWYSESIIDLFLSLSPNGAYSVDQPLRTTQQIMMSTAYAWIFFIVQAFVGLNTQYREQVNFCREILVQRTQEKLIEEEERVLKLLRNLLPEAIVKQLHRSPSLRIAESFDNVTVLYTDMVNFTSYSSRVSATELVEFLNDMYTRFDTIVDNHNLYKVEIIGDTYFAVGGCPTENHHAPQDVILAAVDMLNEISILRQNSKNPDLNIRVGVHTGPVVAGVVGTKALRYHLFGETVTTAQVLVRNGQPGRIHLSETTYMRVKQDFTDKSFSFEFNNMLSVDSKNSMLRTYYLCNE